MMLRKPLLGLLVLAALYCAGCGCCHKHARPAPCCPPPGAAVAAPPPAAIGVPATAGYAPCCPPAIR